MYAIADIVLLPERFASFGFSLTQACAAGISTIASSIPTFREIAVHLSYVRLIENTSKRFSDEILSLVASGDWARKAEEGRAFARQLTWESTADAYVRIIDHS